MIKPMFKFGSTLTKAIFSSAIYGYGKRRATWYYRLLLSEDFAYLEGWLNLGVVLDVSHYLSAVRLERLMHLVGGVEMQVADANERGRLVGVRTRDTLFYFPFYQSHRCEEPYHHWNVGAGVIIEIEILAFLVRV